MRRLNFTFDPETIALLEKLAENFYQGNKSLTVRAALESLASHIGHDGWVVSGYAPIALDSKSDCHSCGNSYSAGEILYRPVFERGVSADALAHMPTEVWLDCTQCVEQRFDK